MTGELDETVMRIVSALRDKTFFATRMRQGLEPASRLPAAIGFVLSFANR
jgi:hypothetical protein